MRKITTILLLCCTFFADATNWYVDNAASGTNSGTISNPWTSLSSIVWGSINAGDTLFISRQVYQEKLTVTRSGSAGNPIIITAYDGADPSVTKPTISGFTNISSWTNVSGNIWESSSAIKSSTTMLNMVTIGNNYQAIGRYPRATDANSGFVAFQTHTGEGTGAVLTSNAISSYPSFVNGEVVIRKNNWITERYVVSGQTGTTVTLGTWIQDPNGNSDVYTLTNNWGFFFRNDADACTQQGDWYYNISTRKLGMYSITNPNSLNVEAATIDTVMRIDSRSYLKLLNLKIEGANEIGLYMASSSNITIDNCEISYIGINGAYGGSSTLSLTNSIFSYINNNGIHNGTGSNVTITGCTFSHISDVDGSAQNSDDQSTAILKTGSNANVSLNVIHDIGYHGYRFKGANTTCRKNYVYNVCLVKNDGGAIYGGAEDFSGTVIDSNIVINSKGATDGTNGGSNYGEGIYVDDAGSNVTITNNTVANCGNAGLFTNGGLTLTYRGNTVYNCGKQFATDNFTGTPSGLSLKKNIFFSFLSSQYCLYANSSVSSSYTNTDSNYYSRPVDDNQIVRVNGTNYTLAGWRTYSGQDAHSLQSPKTVGGSGSGTDSLILVYNPTNHDSTVTLPANYVDVTNTTYNGSITLAPFSSAPLIYLSALPPSGNDFKFKKGRLKFGYGDAYEYFFIPENLLNEASKPSFILKPFSSKVLIYKSKAAGTVLPVSLMNFNTSVSDNIVTVSWSTASENNSDHFEIQVSDDGINWKTVKSVPSKAVNGNSSSKMDYSTQIILK